MAESRRIVRAALVAADISDLQEGAELAVSELMTNVILHAGTVADILVRTSATGLRVEISDGSDHPPSRRTRSATAGTGRGLHLVEEFVDRWGFAMHPGGKTVWFEIGTLEVTGPDGDATRPGMDDLGRSSVTVTLLHVPLLMHWAWQEHAASLLREFLLFSIEDDPGVLEQHAQASDAMALLHEQLPVPALPDDPEALMADAVEPGVTADRVTLEVPGASVAHFGVLDDLLGRAIAHANAGDLLGPPTQPEISEMRQWLCEQVACQASRTAGPTPWSARTDVRKTRAPDPELARLWGDLSQSTEAALATDESSVIIGVTAPALELLGYDDESHLLGRRVIVVVPQRFHQAHIAGTTLHVTNGRGPLLDVELVVPVVRADGSERSLGLTVTADHLRDGRKVFVARFHVPEPVAV